MLRYYFLPNLCQYYVKISLPINFTGIVPITESECFFPLFLFAIVDWK